MDNIEGFIKNCDILVLNIPPKFRSPEDTDYLKNLSTIHSLVKERVKRIILISTTSVYRDTPSNIICTENNRYLDTNEKAKILSEAEDIFFKAKAGENVVLRLGGLIGEDRHPAKFVSGKELSNPSAPVNLIHREDCIGAIKCVIESNCGNEIFNVVYPSHPLKSEYYLRSCKNFGLPPPFINDSLVSKGKIVSSEKIQRALNFKFTHPIG